MKKFVLFAAMALSASGLSQVYSQPWVDFRPSYPSVVETCGVPITVVSTLADDFVLSQPTQIREIVWWGVVTGLAPDPPQLTRRYYIAIYEDLGCMPNYDNIVWQACVTPTARFENVDCQGYQVHRFSAVLAQQPQPLPLPPLLLPAARSYWIQISEIDDVSVRRNLVDFCWSAHVELKHCPAVRRTPDFMVSIIEDICYKPDIDDLAFELY